MRTIYRLGIATALATLPLVSTHASAQSSSIERYWNGLTGAQTIDAAFAIPSPGAEDPCTHEIAEGLQRLRKYEFTLDRTDALMALKHLEHVVRLYPDDAWGHYALGTALARGSDMRLRPYAQKSSYKPGIYSMAALRAPKELERALEIDGNLDLAAIELGQVALDLTDKNLMVKSLEFLNSARRRGVPMAVFMSARLESRLGNSARAIQLGDEAKSLGVDASIIALERVLALARMRAPADTIAKAYFSGVDVLTDQGAERYFAGLVQLASKAEIEAWTHSDVSEKRQWIRRFWAKRAAIAGQPAARQISALYQKYNRAYDIRGMTVIGGTPPEHKPTLLGMIFPRVRVGDPLCKPAPDRPCPIDSNVEVGRLKPGDLAFNGTYSKPVIMAYQVLQFRAGAGGGSQVVGALQVIAESVRSLADRTGVVDATVSINVTDTLSDSIAHTSTRLRFTLGSVDPGAGVLMGVSVAAPPVRRALVSVGIENTSSSSGAVATGEIDVEKFDPDSLTVSDVVLAPAEGNAASFERGAVHVSLAPGHIYHPNDIPTLYYEVYGLPEASALSTRIEIDAVDFGVISGVRKVLGRRPTKTAVSFKESATTSVYGTQQVRQLGLSGLKPGYYAVIVRVTDERGRTAQRERLFEVRE